MTQSSPDFQALGRQAFEAGTKRIVMADSQVVAFIAQQSGPKGRKATLKAMTAWYKGWDQANLAAPW